MLSRAWASKGVWTLPAPGFVADGGLTLARSGSGPIRGPLERPVSWYRTQRSLQSCGDLQRKEALGRVGVILSALVHHAQITVPLRLLVRDDAIQLADLEGGRIALIVHAYGERCPRLSHSHLTSSRNGNFSLSSLLPISCTEIRVGVDFPPMS